MKEFYPWSTAVYQESIEKYKNGCFSILDVQLSGKCNFNCIYCDSPNRNTLSKINFRHLENLIQQEPNRYKWMFICGLGEPIWNSNKVELLQLLELCKNNGIKCTIFTNGSNIDNTILDYISANILFPLVKIDSFDPKLLKKLYGCSSFNLQRNLDNIQNLFDIMNSKSDDYYNIAASIVPTKLNYKEIPSIVERCIENNAFPLLGQLEYAGKAISEYNKLLLSKNELLELKSEINNIIKMEYKIPICPSVISGIHIHNNGYVSVDKKSGLSCSWFWLQTPETVNLCYINEIESLREAEKYISNYRNNTIKSILELPEQVEELPFGGCGGNVIDLINDYVEIQSNL